MTVIAFSAMKSWRRVYVTESVLTMALIETAANEYDRKEKLPPEAWDARMAIWCALLDIAGAYVALNRYLAGEELDVAAVTKFDNVAVPAPTGVKWLDDIRANYQVILESCSVQQWRRADG